MTSRFDLLWAAVRIEIPGARIVRKSDSWFMGAAFGLLKLLTTAFTLGRAKPNRSTFTTTIWRTLYVPDNFWERSDEDRYRLLRHELVHLRQFRRWPSEFLGKRGVWRINAVIMSFCYLFVFPVKWTLRAKLEREGYVQSMLSWYELHDFDDEWCNRYIEKMGKAFGGAVYAYMWNGTDARSWARATMHDIETGYIKNDRDNVDRWSKEKLREARWVATICQ